MVAYECMGLDSVAQKAPSRPLFLWMEFFIEKTEPKALLNLPSNTCCQDKTIVMFQHVFNITWLTNVKAADIITLYFLYKKG